MSVDLSSDVLTFTEARRISVELSNGQNLESNFRRLVWDDLTLTTIQVAGLEPAVKRFTANEDLKIRQKAAFILLRFSHIKEEAEELKKEKKKPKKTTQKPVVLKRKANENVTKEESKVKIAKIEKKVAIKIKAPEATVSQKEAEDNENQPIISEKELAAKLKEVKFAKVFLEEKVAIKINAPEATAEDKENQPMISAEELATKLKALPHHVSPFEAMKFLRSLGGYSANLLEQAETLVGRKMHRVDELWKCIIFIKFGAPKDCTSKDPREQYKELIEKTKN